MKIINYLNKYKEKYIFKVKIKSLSSLNKWIYCKDFIRHVSNKFFQIYGFQIKTNFYKKKKMGTAINCSKRGWNSRDNKKKN